MEEAEKGMLKDLPSIRLSVRKGLGGWLAMT